MDRRRFLALAGRSGQLLVAGALLGGGARSWPASGPARAGLADLDPLGPPDDNGVRLPPGFTSRVVASSGEVPPGARSGYCWCWHGAPDGGAVFAAADDGWIYVSNSELEAGLGGVGALRFDASGTVTDAYPILSGTERNCSGGATPWHTWLSCEEVHRGRVFECDPMGRHEAVFRPALGRFVHEAVVVDDAGRLYLTEDLPDGCFYRFTPDRVDADGRSDLSAGRLEVAAVEDGTVSWLPLSDPSAGQRPTRYQAPGCTAFNGGEGMTFFDGTVYFSTKGDDRIWAYEVETAKLEARYHAGTSATPILRGVDNLETGPGGEVLVAEDGGDMQIVVLTATGDAAPLLQVPGHPSSEITGPAFTPDYRRLYFSSQRGAAGVSSAGVTYEISGPFLPST